MSNLLENESGYWGYMSDDVRLALAVAANAIENDNPDNHGSYFQLLDDGFSTVAVNSLTVGIHGIECLGNIGVPFMHTYADNTAAASLSAGDIYKTPTGELRIKV